MDLIPDVASVLEPVDWVEHGALDLLTTQAIEGLAPRHDERELVSRLRDGSSVRLGACAIAAHLDDAIARCVADGAAVVLVLCTGRVEHGPAAVPVLHAEDLAHEAMTELLGPERQLGVLAPMPEQCGDVQQRWTERLGRPVRVAAVNPYVASLQEVEAAGRALIAAGVDEIFLDCIGYTEAHAQAIAQGGLPSHPARRVAVHTAVQSLIAVHPAGAPAPVMR